MILVNHYAIWPPIPKTIFIKHSRVEIIAFPFALFYKDRFFNRMTILISYFPCLTARFIPREDCSIRPLAPLFAYLRI